MRWAIDVLGRLRRPLICFHPGGNSRSLDGHIWAGDAWAEIINIFNKQAGFFQVGRPEFGDIDLGLPNAAMTLRETMALIWASDMFIGFDSAPMHIATAFEIPTVAIFDMQRKFDCEGVCGQTYIPSVMLRWSYPCNRNVAIMKGGSDQAALNVVVDAIHRRLDKLTYRF